MTENWKILPNQTNFNEMEKAVSDKEVDLKSVICVDGEKM